jgi:hypothetical protein
MLDAGRKQLEDHPQGGVRVDWLVRIIFPQITQIDADDHSLDICVGLRHSAGKMGGRVDPASCCALRRDESSI